MKFDMHCHTKEGSLDGKVPVADYISKLMGLGYDGMLITDHNSYNGYRSWKRTIKDKCFKDFVVLKGIEYDTIDAGHMLIIMPETVKLAILEMRGLPVQFLIDIVHKNGGILGPAHPCGEKYQSILNTRKFREQPAIMERFDFIEAFNACENTLSNAKASLFANQFDKQFFGGSDAHKMECVGLGYTIIEDSVYSESELISYVKAGESVSCGGSYYKGTTKEKMGRANQLLVESFWVYNRLGSMVRHHRRVAELSKYKIG